MAERKLNSIDTEIGRVIFLLVDSLGCELALVYATPLDAHIVSKTTTENISLTSEEKFLCQMAAKKTIQ